MLTNKQLDIKIKEVNKYLLKQYKKLAKEKEEKRDYATYEREFMRRVKTVIRNLEPLLKEATQIRIYRGNGPKPKLTIRQKLRLFLIKQLIDKSNRNMAYMLDLFRVLTGIDVR